MWPFKNLFRAELNAGYFSANAQFDEQFSSNDIKCENMKKYPFIRLTSQTATSLRENPGLDTPLLLITNHTTQENQQTTIHCHKTDHSLHHKKRGWQQQEWLHAPPTNQHFMLSTGN